MKFSQKLFLTIFITSTLSVVAACLLLFSILTHYRHQQFEESYIDHIQLMGVAISRLSAAGLSDPTIIIKDLVDLDDDNLEVILVPPEANETRADGAYWEGPLLTVLGTTKAGRLKATISTQTYNKEVSNLEVLFAVLILTIMTLTYFLSRAFTRLLLKKINSIQSVVASITSKQDYSKRIATNAAKSEDELEQLAGKFNSMFEVLERSQQHLIAATRDKARAEIAAQVAHDIRSPLTSLSLGINEIEKQLQGESVSLLKNAVARISAIAQKISKAKVEATPEEIETPKLTLLPALAEIVVNEHQIRLSADKQLELIAPKKNIWSVVQVNEIQTALSNLINNAFEAGASKVQVEIKEEGKNLRILVIDNGSGIHQENLGKIFERHFTQGKTTGSGLGLDQVKTAVQWNGGTIAVESVVGQGTTFVLNFPLEKEPSFVIKSLQPAPQQKIYFVDDDPSILQIWKEKTKDLRNKIFFFSSLDIFLKEELSEDCLVVIDNNLSASKKGIDVIATLKLNTPAILCTSEHDDAKIQEQIKKLKTKLIPKTLLGDFRIGT